MQKIWSQWPRGLGRTSAASRLLGLWSLGAWTFVCCECCMFSGRGLWDELTTSSENCYRVWCVVACDLETPCMRRPTGGCCVKKIAEEL